MGVSLGKKGVLFTATALVLVTVAIFISLSLTATTSSKNEAIHIRVQTLDSFLDDVKKDFERAIFISSFRSVLALEQYVLSTGTYVDNLDSAFAAALINGSYKNTTLGVASNSTLTLWVAAIQNEASKIGIVVNISFAGIDITHTSPWDVEASAQAVITLSDQADLATFTATHSATTSISILGFEDPLYPLNTLGRVSNVINETPYATFVQGNNTVNLQKHTNNSFYIAHADAPSFLMRLAGNFNNSAYGIESLVYLPDLSEQGVPIKTTSVVDYVYFGNQSVTDYSIQNMPSWFRIDDAHLTTYEVENITG